MLQLGIVARDTRNLQILDADLSTLPRTLQRDRARRSWLLSFHPEHADEWLRHGASILPRRVEGGEIAENRAAGVTPSHDDDDGFGSGTRLLVQFGLGLVDRSRARDRSYRATGTFGLLARLLTRGQDSAALLMDEQSSRMSRLHSITHSGAASSLGRQHR